MVDEPLSRSLEDRHRRPERVERISWWDLAPHRGRRLDGGWGAHLIPLEAVQKGDTQVLLAADPARGGHETVLSLDALADYPDLESVVASATVTASRPLRSVRELLVVGYRAQVPDQKTIANLPRLESLYASATPTRRQLRLEWLPSRLQELAIGWSTSEPQRLTRLGEFVELRRLSLDAGPSTPLAGLANLKRLTYLHLNGGKSGWQKLAGLTELEEVHLLATGLRDLSVASGWTKLHSISLSGRKLTSLDGIERLTGLETCTLDWVAIKDLAPLQGLSRLTDLVLDALVEVRRLDGLRDLPALRRLVMSGAMERDWRIASLEPLAQLEALEELDIGQLRLDDPSVEALARLSNLKRLRLWTLNRVAGLDDFRARRPEVEITDLGSGQEDSGEVEVGPVTIHPPLETGGPWWILQDLSSVLSTATNAEAEGVLRRRLEAENPALLSRLEFDTEAGGVGIRGTEEDLREVAGSLDVL